MNYSDKEMGDGSGGAHWLSQYSEGWGRRIATTSKQARVTQWTPSQVGLQIDSVLTQSKTKKISYNMLQC